VTGAGRERGVVPVRVPAADRRRGHRVDAQVRDRLRHLGAGSGRRVVLVAHSLGGLVAAYWLCVLGGWRCAVGWSRWARNTVGRRRRCRSMATGVLGGRLQAPVDVLRVWPSVAELLSGSRRRGMKRRSAACTRTNCRSTRCADRRSANMRCIRSSTAGCGTLRGCRRSTRGGAGAIRRCVRAGGTVPGCGSGGMRRHG
jgi:hypothetical protein